MSEPGSIVSDDPCTPITLHGPDGAVLTVCAYGGQVLGWAPDGVTDRLWVSPTSDCGDGAALRGGVPVIFPQFSARGPLPKHGLARDRNWSAHALPDAQAAVWQAWLEDDEQTRAIWPHRFALQLTARATAAALDITVRVTNPGDEPFEFSLALHDYLAIGDPAAELSGLGGHDVEQNARPGATGPATSDPWHALEKRDVRVLDVDGTITLADKALGPLGLVAEGFPDRVVWNPGADHGMQDTPAGAERDFVCVEPAVVTPRRLAPGETWTGRQLLLA
jgi:glucose-6-phosphate 1-epimerase